MYIDFSGLFHRSSKDASSSGRIHTPPDSHDWPAEWKTTFYKSYPRFAKIPLPATEPAADFFELIRARRSQRDFSGVPVDIEALSTVLQYSCGITRSSPQGESRAQPSGGARFPLEVYPIVFSGSELVPAGLYHYNVKAHALDTLWQRPFSKEDIAALFTYEWIQNSSVALVVTAVFNRNQMKYGERGYRQILHEAGHVGQNVYLASGALGMKCCTVSGTRDVALEKLIDIDGITESVVYGMVLG